jgi:hypothetical protein
VLGRVCIRFYPAQQQRDLFDLLRGGGQKELLGGSKRLTP